MATLCSCKLARPAAKQQCICNWLHGWLRWREVSIADDRTRQSSILSVGGCQGRLGTGRKPSWVDANLGNDA